MASQIPDATIGVFARSIFEQTRDYGFSQIDTVRLINALMDLSVAGAPQRDPKPEPAPPFADAELCVEHFPLTSTRLEIRRASGEADRALLAGWLAAPGGREFLLSCATAEQIGLDSLLSGRRHHLGIVALKAGDPLGAVAFLDHDLTQQRAELRKMIAVPAERGKGYGREATLLWLKYGVQRLGLEKIYLSTLQNELGNIRLNESLGFRVEGVLADEVLIDGERKDVLRMGLSCARRHVAEG